MERGANDSGSSSGTGSLADELVMSQPPFQNGLTRTLSVSDFVSDRVTIVFSNGVPSVANFVFKMHKRLAA